MENIGGLIRVFKIVAPFIGEVLFGDKKESAEVMRRNKMVVFLIGCLFVGFAFYYHNSYLYDQLYTANMSLSQELAVLQSKYDASSQTNQLLNTELTNLRSRVVCPGDQPLEQTAAKPETPEQTIRSLREENKRLKGENSALKHPT